MFELRDYQKESHNAAMKYIEGNRRKSGIIVVPTGGGKSLLQAKLVQDYGGKAVILSPSIEILKQNYKKFTEFGGEASIYSAALKSREIGAVTYASTKSVAKLGKDFKAEGVQLLILDECHLGSDASGGMFKKFLAALAPKFIVGYTATPFRLSSSMGPNGYPETCLTMLPSTFPKIFDDYIHITQISELIDKGYWASIDLEPHSFNSEGLLMGNSGNDFNEDAVITRNKAEGVNNKLYKRLKELMKTRNAILVFMDSVDNCEVMKKALGPLAETVHGKVKIKDRTRIVDEFKEGKLKVVICHSSLVVGFDFPGLDTVCMGRPTNSLAIFYQIYGRLVRPMEGKKGLFVDYGGNLSRFGNMHDIVIENYRGIGHEVFNQGRMVSGLPLNGPEVRKKQLDEMVERRLSVEAAIKPDLSLIMSFGKHKDKVITDVPHFYLKWLSESNIPMDNVLKVTVNTILKKPTSLY